MKTKQLAIAITTVVILANSALVFSADATPKAETPKVASAKPLGKLTCEEFISFEDVIKPQYVIAAAAHTKGGKAKNTVIEIVDTDTLVPVLIEECQKVPTDSFWEKLKRELDKIKSKL
jgi:hypothetical protein